MIAAEVQEVAVALVIVATIVGVALGRYPWVRMNRATIALVGAAALLALGALTPQQAAAAVDIETLVLLFAMMIVNANLRLAGLFTVVTGRILRHAHTPRRLLALLVLTSGVLSALFLNDTIVLAFTPLVVQVTLTLARNPVPYLIALVAAANVGSVATITGNPQNMFIGTASGISYASFAAHLAPLAVLGLGLVWAVTVLLYRREFAHVRLSPPATDGATAHPYLLAKGLIATAAMLAMLLLGVTPALAALLAASALLITRRLKPDRVFREVDYSLLVFFASLFVVTDAVRHTALMPVLESAAAPVIAGAGAGLVATAAVLSNLVSNVPAVLLFAPLVERAAAPDLVWITIAMATTFAGNLTLLGSVANLIVAETARRGGVELRFGEYLRAGVPITLATLALGTLWLALWR